MKLTLCFENGPGRVTTMDFHKDGNHHWAVLHTHDGQHIYLPREFVEAAAHGWDAECPKCNDRSKS